MQALKALVIGMAVLSVVGAGVVAVTIYKRATTHLEGKEGTAAAEKAATEKPPEAEKRGFGTQHIVLPEGAHLDDVTTSGNRMILRLRLADGSPHLIVVDLDSGATLGEFDFGP